LEPFFDERTLVLKGVHVTKMTAATATAIPTILSLVIKRAVAILSAPINLAHREHIGGVTNSDLLRTRIGCDCLKSLLQGNKFGLTDLSPHVHNGDS